MKAKVTARYWDSELQSRFGSFDSIHNFPNDTETFLKEVMKFGRFETKLEGDLLTLEFQNDYD
jgi:hypothetical protein